MATFNVHAPEVDYAGAVGNVQFADGKAVIDDEVNSAELAYCQNAGYRVEPVEEPKAEQAETKPAPRRAAAKKESDK